MPIIRFLRIAILINLLSFFVFVPLKAKTQLSKSLVHILPDSCKPKPIDKKVLDQQETFNILDYVSRFAYKQFKIEPDSMAADLEKESAFLQNSPQKIEIEKRLEDYYSRTHQFGKDLDHCDMILGLVKDKKEYDNLRSDVEMLKGSLLSRFGRHEESIQFLYTALDRAKNKNDSIGISKIYFGLSYPYLFLDLPENALSVIDSSILYYGKINAGIKKKDSKDFLKALFHGKYLALLSIYEKTSSPAAIAQMKALATFRETEKLPYQIIRTFPVIESYSRQEFAKAISLSDSISAADFNNNFTSNQYEILIIQKYKALSLYKLGKEAQAIELMRNCIATTQDNEKKNGTVSGFVMYSIEMISRYIYNYYLQKKQWGNAGRYLLMNKEVSEKMNILSNRGKVLEVEEKYRFAKKELEMEELKNESLSNSKQRNIALATLALSLFALTFFILLSYLRIKGLKQRRMLERLESEKRINQLKTASYVQIAKLEEEYFAQKKLDEKQLGMDLHDGLASQLAYINKLVDNYIMDAGNASTAHQFYKLNGLISVAYNSIRQKSHELVSSAGSVGEELPFSERITAILASALPVDLYELEIKIDDQSLASVELPVKIEMLYILQEAAANIIKHANANKIAVTITVIEEKVMMRIKDDGKGFDTEAVEKNKAIGLQNIKERSLNISGAAEIRSGDKGTEIIISAPVHSSLPLEEVI